MKNILCFGEALIDFLNIGQTRQGPLTLPEFRQYPGGAPANAAVAVARLGGKAQFIGQVGNDPFGDFLEQALKAYGVDTRLLLKHPSAKTALAFVMLDEQGDRSFAFHRHETADLLFNSEQLQDQWFDKDDLLHICSNTLTTPEIARTTGQLVEMARGRGALVSFDVNLRHNLWPEGAADRQRVNQLVRRAHLVKFSRDELDYLAQGHEDAYLQQCLASGCRLLMVTDGANRIDFISTQGRGSLQPPAVKVADTTAGGDAFIGGLLYALSCMTSPPATLDDPATLKTLLAFAAQCGAIAVTRPGAFPALPDLPAVRDALQADGQDLNAFPSDLFRSLK